MRKSFARVNDEGMIPDLISLQVDSYNEFLQLDADPSKREDKGLQAVFSSYFPLSDGESTSMLEFVSYSIGEPKYNAKDSLVSGKTFASPLTAKLRLILWDDIEEGSDAPRGIKAIKEQEVYLCDVPMMTVKGGFIINGAERVIVSQMRRAPGVFFDSENSKINNSKVYTSKIIPATGSWLDFEFDTRDVLYFRIDRKRKIPITSFLIAMGMSLTEILKSFYNEVELQYSKKGWSAEFDYENVLGKRFLYKIVDAKTGKELLEENKKITKKTLKKLEEADLKRYLLDEDMLLSYAVSDDIIDEETGEVLLEAGSAVTEENLEILKKMSFKSIKVVNTDQTDMGSYVYDTLLEDKNRNQVEALYDIYKSARLGETPSSPEIAERFFNTLFFADGRYNLSDVGRMKINYRLGLDVEADTMTLTKKDILAVIKMLCNLKYTEGKTDDIDNLVNRRIRSVGELVENQVRIGMSRIERTIVEKMNSVDIDTVMPQNLINAKPLISSVRDFFATSQLSQFMDQVNPLAEVTHKRRLSALGPGGLTRERAGFEVRDVHPTHYGRICPVETPEGANIGLINSLSTFARINNYGFIETPYRKVKDGVVTDEVIYLSALEEDRGYNIAQANIKLDKKGKIISDLVSCRRNDEYLMVAPEEVDYVDISPKQLVSIATTLIPFLENCDAKRALMGSNMMRQAVPLVKTEAPFVGTGMESVVAKDSGCVVIAGHEGIVRSVDASKIIIERNDENHTGLGVDVYNLNKYVRTNHDTAVNQTPLIEAGELVKAGQVIADGQSTDKGELALGKNVLVAYMSWNGYNYEDSILISERLVKEEAFTSIHIEEFEIVARDTRLGPEEITRDIPNVSEEVLRKLDESGIIHVGAEVNSGDILVGKTTPKSESPMTPEEKLLKVIFGEKASDVKDSSLYLPHGVSNGVVVDVKVFTRRGIEKDERSIYAEMQEIEEVSREKDKEIAILETTLRRKVLNVAKGKKLSEEISKYKASEAISDEMVNSLSARMLAKLVVADQEVMDRLEKLTTSYQNRVEKLEKLFETRIMKIKEGDELAQGVLKVVKVYVATKYKLQPGDKMAGRHGNKGVVSKVLPVEDMPYLEDGTPVDLVLNPLGIPSRMNIGQVLEVHLGWASKNLGKRINAMLTAEAEKKAKVKEIRELLLNVYTRPDQIEAVKKANDEELVKMAKGMTHGLTFGTSVFEDIEVEEIEKLLELSGVDKSGSSQLTDGRTGELFPRKATVGYIYLLKLHHLVDDKIHARSIGPYSLITQQPLGGKSHFGGQRFGEMECWALQAYGAAYTLQEMLTVKSDDVIGRIKIYESIIQGNQNFTCGIPESFNVMVKEVRSLGLNIELVKE